VPGPSGIESPSIMTERPIVYAALAAASLLALAPAAARADINRATSPACAQAGVAVEVTGATSRGDAILGEGTWKALGGADGVTLEVHIHGDRYHVEHQKGAAGSFRFDGDFKRCGTFMFRVYAYPTVREDGREVECLTRSRTVGKKFTRDCAPTAEIVRCAWECADDPKLGCAGTCTGAARGGEQTLVGLWGVDDAGYDAVAGSPYGPWMAVVRCKPGERVSFKVRDHGGAGAFSAVASKPCGTE